MNIATNVSIFFTIFFAMILELIPFSEALPAEIGFLRPELGSYDSYLLDYCSSSPSGVVLAWISGIIMDILVGNFLGQFGCCLRYYFVFCSKILSETTYVLCVAASNGCGWIGNPTLRTVFFFEYIFLMSLLGPLGS